MIPTCPHWTDCNVEHGGCCALGLYGGKPSHGVCNGCVHNAKRGQWNPVTDPVQVHIPTEAERAAAREKRDTLTRRLWREMHAAALRGELTDAKLDELGKQLPCGECAVEFARMRSAHPLPADADGQFALAVEWHNAVNAKLGKPLWTVEEASRCHIIPCH